MFKYINTDFYLQGGTLREAIKKINGSGLSSIVLVNKYCELVKVISDGDIRRHLNNGGVLDDKCEKVRVPSLQKVINEPLDVQSARNIFKKNPSVNLLPVISKSGRVVNILTRKSLHDLIPISVPYLEKEDIINCQSALADNWISSKGSFITQFEDNLSEVLGGNVLTVTNGTVAIELALKALGLTNGAKVGVPDFTFAATINAVLNVGAVPVILPVDKHSWKITSSYDQLIDCKLDGIVLVNIYGLQYSSSEIKKFKLSCNTVVVDSAEALAPNIYRNKIHIDAITYSFFANKILTTGEGGAVGFTSKEAYQKSLIIRDHGMSVKTKYWHDHVGSNYRMTNLQAALGSNQILRLNDILKKRKYIFNLYNDQFDNHKCKPILHQNMKLNGSPWLYTVQFDEAINVSDILSYLMSNLIEARPVFYPLSAMKIYEMYVPSNFEPCYRNISGISLPTFIGLDDEKITKITSVLVNYFNE